MGRTDVFMLWDERPLHMGSDSRNNFFYSYDSLTWLGLPLSQKELPEGHHRRPVPGWQGCRMKPPSLSHILGTGQSKMRYIFGHLKYDGQYTNC